MKVAGARVLVVGGVAPPRPRHRARPRRPRRRRGRLHARRARARPTTGGRADRGRARRPPRWSRATSPRRSGGRASSPTPPTALGGLDALVYAASGPFVPQPPQAIDEAAWDASWTPSPRASSSRACAAHERLSTGRRDRRHHRLPRPAAVGDLRRPRRRQGGRDPPGQGARPGVGARRRARLRRRARPGGPATTTSTATPPCAPRPGWRPSGSSRRPTSARPSASASRRDGVTGVNVAVDNGSLVCREVSRAGAARRRPARLRRPAASGRGAGLPFLDWSMSSLALRASQNSMRSCDWSRSRPVISSTRFMR